MPKKAASSEEKRRSDTLSRKTAEERALHRLRSAQLVIDGASPKDVAKRYGDSPRALAYWVERFKAGGFANLLEKKRNGRPPRLDSSQMKKVRFFVQKERSARQNVNAEILGAYIKKTFKTSMSTRQLWRILKGIV